VEEGIGTRGRSAIDNNDVYRHSHVTRILTAWQRISLETWQEPTLAVIACMANYFSYAVTVITSKRQFEKQCFIWH
jgi:hypothetical protein